MNGSVIQFAAIMILLGIDSVIDIKIREIPNLISGAIALTAFLNPIGRIIRFWQFGEVLLRERQL